MQLAILTFVHGKVGVEISAGFDCLRSKMAVDCGAQKMYLVVENEQRAQQIEKQLYLETTYHAFISVVRAGNLRELMGF